MKQADCPVRSVLVRLPAGSSVPHNMPELQGASHARHSTPASTPPTLLTGHPAQSLTAPEELIDYSNCKDPVLTDGRADCTCSGALMPDSMRVCGH